MTIGLLDNLYRPIQRDAILGLNQERHINAAVGTDTAAEINTALFVEVPAGYVHLVTQVVWFLVGGGSQQARTWGLTLRSPVSGVDDQRVAGGQACLSVSDIYDHQLTNFLMLPGEQLFGHFIFNGGTSSNVGNVHVVSYRIPKANIQATLEDL